MRTYNLLLLATFIPFFIGCNNLEIKEANEPAQDNVLPHENVQICIDNLSINKLSKSRSNVPDSKMERTEEELLQEATIEEVTSHDYISDTNISYYLASLSDSIYGIDINKDGYIDMQMSINNNNIIESRIGSISNCVSVSRRDEGDFYILSFTPIESRGYRHTSWWKCVENLATNKNLTIPTMLGSYLWRSIYLYTSATAAIVCLDSRLRWEYTRDCSITIPAKQCIEMGLTRPTLFLDGYELRKKDCPIDDGLDLYQEKINILPL